MEQEEGQKPFSAKQDRARKAIREVRAATRRKFSAEEKIRIVLEGLRGDETISELCRREGIAPTVYYQWSKSFLEAGKLRLTRETKRHATSEEVRALKRENEDLKRLLADRCPRWSCLKKVWDPDAPVAPEV